MYRWEDGSDFGPTDADGVEYRYIVEEETDIEVEGSFASDDPEADAALVAKIKRDMRHNVWAWCMVTVMAKHPDHPAVGFDYLGGCSYAGLKDFMHPEGYAPGMRHEARGDLLATLRRRANPQPDLDALALLQKLKTEGQVVNDR